MKKAFTLIELLVIIAIIGTLVALIIPVVNGVREASSKAAVTSNEPEHELHRIGHIKMHTGSNDQLYSVSINGRNYYYTAQGGIGPEINLER